MFERIIDPLVDWSATWARLEEAVGDFVRPNGPDGKNGGAPLEAVYRMELTPASVTVLASLRSRSPSEKR